MSKFLQAATSLVQDINASVKEIAPSLPFDYTSMIDDSQLPTFLNIGNLIGKGNNSYPALLPLKKIKGIAFQLNDSNREEVHLAIQHYLLQIIERSKEGNTSLTVIDTKKMGSNFRNLRRLGKNILAHFVADAEGIKANLDDHYSKSVSVITECLTNYENLATYNQKSGHVQPYRLLAIADFPDGFNNLDRLEALLQNADESGIFVFLTYDESLYEKLSKMGQDKFRQILSHLISLEEFGNPENDFYGKSKYNVLGEDEMLPPYVTPEILDALKTGAKLNAVKMYKDLSGLSLHEAKEFIDTISSGFVPTRTTAERWLFPNYIFQLNRKDISLDNINAQINRLAQTTIVEDDKADGLRIPIGKTSGQTHYLTFGFETDNYSAIIGGQAGKGKSNLLNNIIGRGMETYSSDELRFAIIDCSGVGFYEFEDAPNVELMCRSSDVEKCLIAVQYIEKEFARREVLFQEAGVADLKKYRVKTGLPLPRLICLIDEFHVLFTGKEKFSSYFDTILVDKVIRIGRKFGFHLVTCTQSLGGGVRRSILDNIPLRIALGMTTDQSNGFLGLKNDAAANLERGVAVYNPQNGNVSANKIVKVNYMSDSDIERTVSLAKQQNANSAPFQKIII